MYVQVYNVQVELLIHNVRAHTTSMHKYQCTCAPHGRRLWFGGLLEVGLESGRVKTRPQTQSCATSLDDAALSVVWLCWGGGGGGGGGGGRGGCEGVRE